MLCTPTLLHWSGEQWCIIQRWLVFFIYIHSKLHIACLRTVIFQICWFKILSLTRKKKFLFLHANRWITLWQWNIHYWNSRASEKKKLFDAMTIINMILLLARKAKAQSSVCEHICVYVKRRIDFTKAWQKNNICKRFDRCGIHPWSRL